MLSKQPSRLGEETSHQERLLVTGGSLWLHLVTQLHVGLAGYALS